MPDPATDNPSAEALNTQIAHVDAATERLIVEWPSVAGEPLAVENGQSLLVLIAQHGDGVYSRPFTVQNTQRAAGSSLGRPGWLVLRPTDLWQRIACCPREAIHGVVPSGADRYSTPLGPGSGAT